MFTLTPRIRTIDLGHDQLMVLDSGRGERVRVLSGAAWLTQEGEPGDAFLRPGEELPLCGGRTLIEALEPTRLQILAGAPAAGPAAGMRRLLRLARHWATRLQLGPLPTETTA